MGAKLMIIPKRFSRFGHRVRRMFFRTRKRTVFTVFGTVLVICLLLVGGAYLYVTHGGMIARQKPAAIEAYVAGKLVDWSIPNDAKGRKNPLDSHSDGADVAAGRELYQQNCEVCHGFDGAGRTASGGGLYPPPATGRLHPQSSARRFYAGPIKWSCTQRALRWVGKLHFVPSGNL
jgi:hypothetical protein